MIVKDCDYLTPVECEAALSALDSRWHYGPSVYLPSDRHSGEEDLRHGRNREEDQEWSDHHVLHGQCRHSEQLPLLQQRDFGLMAEK